MKEYYECKKICKIFNKFYNEKDTKKKYQIFNCKILPLYKGMNLKEVLNNLNYIQGFLNFYKGITLKDCVKNEVFNNLRQHCYNNRIITIEEYYMEMPKYISSVCENKPWYTLRAKLPELNTYVLLYVNRPWHDEDDDPKYVVAKFVANCEKEGELKYKFEQFGPDTFSLDDVKYWTNINRIK